jgi:protoporphyrinogen oxidase
MRDFAEVSTKQRAVVIGGGPAGLSAAHTLQTQSDEWEPIVFEGGDIVGGIARTENHKGYRFDIGGHRFFTKVDRVREFWRELAGDEFLTRPRQSRIYYEGKYYSYPLRIFNALGNMGPVNAVRIMASYAKARVKPDPVEENLEQWVRNRFGDRLYRTFFKTYTEKVWGMPCTEIRADWAAQRIKNLSVLKAVWNAMGGGNDTVSLIEEFEYPRLGPGQMWELCENEINERGGQVLKKHWVKKVHRKGNVVTAIDVQEEGGETRTVKGDTFLNTMDLRTLIGSFSPPPPAEVVEAAEKLSYRDFLIVTLILDHPDPFPDNWIYVHSPEVSVGRIQNFRAWSPDMVPDDSTSSIGMEYFCHEGDGLWQMSEEELIELAGKELEELGLAAASTVVGGKIIRQPKAYPVYDGDYQNSVDTILGWINTLDNFQTMGRNGMHRYNNQDHSILTAMLAAENVLGASHDLSKVNVDRAYHEDFTVEEKQKTEAAA